MNSAAIEISQQDRKESSNTITSSPCYILMISGDDEFKLNAQVAKSGGKKAIYLPEGWVYKNRDDAEAVAERYTKEGKRTIIVRPWYNSLAYEVWYGSKEQAVIAKKKISQDISRHHNNKNKQKLEIECDRSGLHHSWLYTDSLPDDMSDKEWKLHSHYRPLWSEALKKAEEIEFREHDIKLMEEDLKESSYEIGQEVIVGGIPKIITDMESLDRRFAQLEAPGQPCVYINRKDAQSISFTDFSRRLSGEVVQIGFDSNGQPKYIPASKYWEGSSRKQIYRKIVFTKSETAKDAYNLFTGFGVCPKKGTCERILNHIREVICAGDEKNNEALLKLLAWQIQNIGKPSRVIVLLKSEAHQAGKGTLLQDILAKIYGNAGYVTQNLDQITGRFNDSIRGKAYIYLDEALFSGDRKAADAIKSLSTASSIGVESKGVPTVQLPIGLNFFLSTNHKDAAHIEEGDARYWILEVSESRVKDVSYFNDLYAEINSDGLEAFMDFILHLDVSEFVPMRDVPKDNAAKEEMIRNSINPFDARKWIEECCYTGMILGLKPLETLPYEKTDHPWQTWNKTKEYDNGNLYIAYIEWQKTVKSPMASKPTPSNKFGEMLNNLGFNLRIQDSKRWRSLPDPSECIASLKDLIRKPKK